VQLGESGEYQMRRAVGGVFFMFRAPKVVAPLMSIKACIGWALLIKY
jgi:hypothetical protein